MFENSEFSKIPSQIEKETGRRFVDICRDLIAEGMSPTEIAKQLRLKTSRYVNKALYEDKIKNMIPQNLMNHSLLGLTFAQIEEIFPKLFGQSYKEYLFQKYIVDGLSQYELSTYIGCDPRSISNHLSHYGIKKTRYQSRKDAIKKGLINYKKITSDSRRTRRKSNTSSNSQEMLRDMFKTHIEKYLINNDLDEYEVVVGFNEYGILKDSEVDIPIVIINNHLNKYYKFSIEQNCGFWHKNENKDIRKLEKLTRNGWKHFTFIYTANFSNDEQNVIKITEKIFLIITLEDVC